ALELGGDLGGADDRGHGGDLLGLGPDDAAHAVGRQQLADGGHRVSLVALGVRVAGVELLAEDAAGTVDDLLGDLRALEHRLAEHRKRAGEAREHAERHVTGAVGLDVATAAAAARGGAAARGTLYRDGDTGEQAFWGACLRDPGQGCRRHCQPPSVARSRAVPDYWRQSAPMWPTMSMGRWSYQFCCNNRCP